MANLSTMNDLAAQSLDLVSRELTSTLEGARRELESFIDGRSGREALIRTAEALHLAAGALKIVDVQGAALLADEMEQTCRRLSELEDQDALDEGVETLTRAMVQLPAYLDRLLSGGRDVALVLLPLLNDLRKVRGKPLLSEGTLVLLNTGPFHARGAGAAPAVAAGGDQREFQRIAQKLRPAFQGALLGWIRGERLEHHLRELIKITARLEGPAKTEPVRQFWHVLSGVLIALEDKGLEASVALKRLLGQVDRQLKRLIDAGEIAFGNAPPVDVLNNLLYYVARADSRHEKVDAIRQAFGLSEMIPGEEQLVEARANLAGPSVRLMRTVAQAIKEDLGHVKDALDIFVRTGMSDIDQLGPQLEMLKKVSDTLGVLGLEKLRQRIQGESGELGAIMSRRDAPGEASLEKIAATLLDVEDALDRELVRAIAPSDGAARAADAEQDSEAQHRHVTQAVMGECIVNLAKVKEAVSQLVQNPGNVRALDQVAPQLRGITAGLLMLNKTRAVRVTERIGAVITSHLSSGAARPAASRMERLADAIVSVEYYMETVSAGRQDPWYMLDNAERCLALLEQAAPAAPEPAAARAPEPVPPAKRPEPAVMEVEEHRSDPELLELFIEEAKEEIANIERYLPTWTENPGNSEALISVRRSFHTLKGSGRMVGAQLIGEYAWSVESLLNRIINQTLEPSPGMIQFIGESAHALPQLVEQLEIGVTPKLDIHLLMKQAEAFAEGDPQAQSLTRQSLRVPAPAQSGGEDEGEAQGERMDPVLAEIFVKEMRSHLEAIRGYLAEAEGRAAPYAVAEPLYRACHTLLGSANMAGFKPAITLAAPLEEHLQRHYEAGSGMSQAGLEALRSAAEEIEGMAQALAEGIEYTADLSAAVERLAALAPQAGRPAPADRAAAAREEDIEMGDFDPEIAAIFAEEASELLEKAETALQNLRHDARQVDQLAELQRLLHTLKGGARMAGVASMGNLSHALESLLSQLAEGRLQPARETIGLIQDSLDALHHMRDAIDAGRAVAEPATLIERIETTSPAAPAGEPPLSEAETGGTMVLPPFDIPPSGPARDDRSRVGDTGVLELSDEDFAELEAIGDITGAHLPGERIAAQTPPPAEPPREEAPYAEEPAPEERYVEELPREAPYAEEPAAKEPLAAAAHAATEPPAAVRPMEPAPASAPAASERAETARVDTGLLDSLLNAAGEINIFQSRLGQQVHSIDFHLNELGQTVTRLREQLRKLEAETEAQILNRHQQDVAADQGFDPLELDRYSTIQQLSRALAETANDVASIDELLRGLTTEADTLLTQQARVTTELQDGLMQTRMVPFQRHVSRFARIVRQAASESGKAAELVVDGAGSELDRQVLDSMLPALEHLLRNAVVHGIEPPDTRRARGKTDIGRVSLNLKREGSEVLIEVADDGGGLDLGAIRSKAREQRLLGPDQQVSDEEAKDLILKPGFSTAGKLTQAAGRGVGLDIVDNEVKKLGGSMRIETSPERGTRFIIRLPYTLAITQALIVNVGEETFALPLPTVEGITRLPKDQLLALLTQDEPKLEYGGVSYRVQHLGSFVGAGPSAIPEEDSGVALVLVHAGESSTALLTDSLEGSREIVVKTLGPHLTSVPGVSGATILGDGRIIVILDAGTLVRSHAGEVHAAPVAEKAAPEVTALVVDDSITMRRVTERLLERRGVRVLTARDGLDAITVLQEHEPDIILLDIEMPRMDGYQFATHVRNDPKLKDVPIIMVTSRSGEKHRAKAIEIGINDYLSKPYQEGQLVSAMEALLGRRL